MRIYAVNGTSFVGKSTLLKHLHTRLQGKCAILDGDDVGRVFPYELSPQWLDLIQDNILACALNFDAAGVDWFLFAFPFPNSNRIDRLNSIFQSRGHRVNWINLVASEAAIEERFRARGGTKPRNLRLGIDMNRSIAELNGFFTINVTDLAPEQLVSIVLDHIQKGTQPPDAGDDK